MAFSLDQALAEYFDNSGGGGAGYGGTGQGGDITGNPTGGGGSGSSYGRYQIGADGTLYLRNHNGEYVHVGTGGTYMGPVRDWTTQGLQYVTHILGVRSAAEYSQIAEGYFGQGGTTYLYGSSPGFTGSMAFLNVYRLKLADGTYTYGLCDGIYLYETSSGGVRGAFPICPAWYQGGYVGGVLGVNYAPKFKVADGVPFMTTTVGHDGDDQLTGEGWLIGGAGNDDLTGGSEADILEGGSGSDMLKGGGGSDLLDGGDGWDVVSYMSATSGLTVDLTSNANSGAASGDKILHVEVLQGTNHADLLTGVDRGGGSGVQLYGEGGDDGLTGKAGGDALFGGAGNDWLDGGPGGDILDGGAGWDVLSYQSATSGVVVDMTGNANGGAAAGDQVSNIEVLQGSNFADTLTSLDRGGGSGAQLYGEGGHDTLLGKAGGDYLFGGAGNDTLDSGFGGDVLNGGAGTDTFRFSTALGAGNVDTVQDFSAAEGDRIVLSRSVFASAGYDYLAGSAFALGAAATTAAHRIVYNQSTGELFYDADGAGGVAAIKFAVIANHLQLSASSFQIL
jgi:Ca2+-binding RTX toxin-like protein